MNNARIAILDGGRTPFVRAGGGLASLTPLELGSRVVRQLVDDHGLDSVPPDRLAVVWGTSLSYPWELYGGREIAIDVGMPAVTGHATEFACATSVKTAVEGALLLQAGEHDVVVAGGSESLSHQPLRIAEQAQRLARLRRDRHPDEFAAQLLELTLQDLVPQVPGISEPYTGKTLAYYAETMMADWGISRSDADAYATLSHQRAAAARDRLARRLVPVQVDGSTVEADDLVRPETTVEVLAGLPMIHPELGGGVSPGNSSRLTDGAGAVLLSTEAWANESGVPPQGWIRGWALTAHDPDEGVLLGPAHAIPAVLERTGLTLDQIDVLEFHEAFAGQVLANLAALADDSFAQDRLGRKAAVGHISPDDINAWGGSIPLGHPFGATGARLIAQTLDRLEAEGGRLGLLALCVGGTRGAAMVVERA